MKQPRSAAPRATTGVIRPPKAGPSPADWSRSRRRNQPQMSQQARWSRAYVAAFFTEAKAATLANREMAPLRSRIAERRPRALAANPLGRRRAMRLRERSSGLSPRLAHQRLQRSETYFGFALLFAVFPAPASPAPLQEAIHRPAQADGKGTRLGFGRHNWPARSESGVSPSASIRGVGEARIA